MNDNTHAAKVGEPFAFFPYFISMKNSQQRTSKNENNNI